MKDLLRVVTLTCMVTAGVGTWVPLGYGEPYELSKNDVMDPKTCLLYTSDAADE